LRIRLLHVGITSAQGRVRAQHVTEIKPRSELRELFDAAGIAAHDSDALIPKKGATCEGESQKSFMEWPFASGVNT
jgi:hypothetical protein